jgi:hypothetical protein
MTEPYLTWQQNVQRDSHGNDATHVGSPALPNLGSSEKYIEETTNFLFWLQLQIRCQVGWMQSRSIIVRHVPVSCIDREQRSESGFVGNSVPEALSKELLPC